MATSQKIVAADLADSMFGFRSKTATGEMNQADLDTYGRSEWPLHFAIADALGGKVVPFDTYQGPYISIGGDLRLGEGPYAMAPRVPGLVRLWIYSEDGETAVVYNEDTDEESAPFLLGSRHSEEDAVDAARMLVAKNITPSDSQNELNATPAELGPAEDDKFSSYEPLNSPIEGKSAHLVKTADGSMLVRDDHPSSSSKLQTIMGDSMDQPISAFAQFYPNPGSTQLPNPLSPIEGDACFFTYMIPGAVFQSHDGQQWVIDDYNAASYGVELYNRWYPRLRAFVNLDDVRRSINSWIEPVQVSVPPPPPGVTYTEQPVRQHKSRA